jgi:hypothetical protein
MPKGWPHIESKTNAERGRKQRHAPKGSTFWQEWREKNFVPCCWSSSDRASPARYVCNHALHHHTLFGEAECWQLQPSLKLSDPCVRFGEASFLVFVNFELHSILAEYVDTTVSDSVPRRVVVDKFHHY